MKLTRSLHKDCIHCNLQAYSGRGFFFRHDYYLKTFVRDSTLEF